MEENPRNEICFIAPTEQLAERARKIIREDRLPISVYRGALDEAVTIAQTLMDTGTWLFISRKGTRHVLEERLHAKVVGISLEASDYIPAIEQARREKGLVAFFSYEDISNELQTICYLLGIKMRCYHFHDNQSCKKSVEQACQDGAQLGIGGIVSEYYAEKMKLKHIVVESSDSSVRQAIETACQMLAIHKEDEKKREEMQIRLERYENILNYTHDAIIAVDAQGRIDVVNKVAREMLITKAETCTGRLIEEVLPNTRMHEVLRSGEIEIEIDQLMNINGTLVSTNRTPIMVNNQIKGVVATFQDIKSLQNAEQNIRIKIHEKGLTAKYRFTHIIGKSKAIQKARELAETFADSPFTIMLYGETGTGKELFAQSIHNASPRRNAPFVAVNCTALSKTLLESELFGYDDSSFTGARRGGKAGLFELAHGGTIFLDEIGELPLETQAQFLRVLQEKEVRRVGGGNVIPVDVRIISATNRDLLERVHEGYFRNDLYYRLNVLNIDLPALREREDDYLEIALSIYKKLGTDDKAQNKALLLDVLRRYSDYPWPGNIRELTNIVEKITLLLSKNLDFDFILSYLDDVIVRHNQHLHGQESKAENLPDTLQDFELAKIKELLAKNGGNISQTANELRVSRSTIYRKLKGVSI